jgi:hypothetical protein
MKTFSIISALAIIAMASSCRKDTVKPAAHAAAKDSAALKATPKVSKPLGAAYDYQKQLWRNETPSEIKHH